MRRLHRARRFGEWLLLAALLVFASLAVYCFTVSRAAQNVVTAANGPPLLLEPVDFSKPFTNEFAFRHTVQPFYGTTFLTLRANPWPKEWTARDVASEDLQTAKGHLRIISTNNIVVQQRALDWFYWHFSHTEPDAAPLQGVAKLPLGDYRLIVATTNGVPRLNGVKQQLVLRYDYIHEASIARALRTFSVAFAIGAFASASALIWLICRRRELALQRWN